MLDPELYWINACFEKMELVVGTGRISSEISRIFEELYNIYALASASKVIPQPKPKSGPYEPKITIDSRKSVPKSDEKTQSDVKRFLLSLKTSKKVGKTHFPGRRDQYFVKRVALDLDLKPYQLNHKGSQITIYSDHDVRPLRDGIMKNYFDFRQRLDRIESLLELPENFLKVMHVDPRSDARYHRFGRSNSIFLNLARFNQNKNVFFWLFAVARELSYIKARRLGYYFINQLRDILTVAVASQAQSRRAEGRLQTHPQHA